MSTKVITPEFIASYSHVWEPQETPNGKLKFSISMVFPKGTDMSTMQKAAEEAVVKKWGENRSKWPKGLKMPFRKGDDDRADDPIYAGSIFINASSDKAPGIGEIVNGRVQPIINQMDFYSGCMARASVNFFAYDQAGNRGVGVGLQNVLKVSDGDRIDGRASVEDDFSSLAGERESNPLFD